MGTGQTNREVIDDMESSQQSMDSAGGHSKDSTARNAGLFLLLTAAATVVMVYARVAADADQDTLLESLRAIAANKGMYNLSGAARLVSGITLIVGAFFLWKTWIIREGFGTRLVPLLFAVSGVFTAVSGALAIALAGYATAGVDSVNSSTETVAFLRWFTGKIGFAAAGLALLAAAQRQWKAGHPIRRIAPASALIGIAMQLIWVDAATILHRISGVAFFVWLIAIGLMLLSGRVERHFSSIRDAS